MINIEFIKKVYKIVSEIPEGKVTTYGHIAKAIGENNKSRQVGFALNKSFNSNLPCHRVVNHKGFLTGSMNFETPTLMRELLESENIEFINNHINMKKHLWVPPLNSFE